MVGDAARRDACSRTRSPAVFSRSRRRRAMLCSWRLRTTESWSTSSRRRWACPTTTSFSRRRRSREWRNWPTAGWRSLAPACSARPSTTSRRPPRADPRMRASLPCSADRGHESRSAWHLALATVAPDEGVARRMEAVARESQARDAPVAAARAFEASARVTPDGRRRATRLLAAGQSLHLAGRFDEAVAVLDRGPADGGRAVAARRGTAGTCARRRHGASTVDDCRRPAGAGEIDRTRPSGPRRAHDAGGLRVDRVACGRAGGARSGRTCPHARRCRASRHAASRGRLPRDVPDRGRGQRERPGPAARGGLARRHLGDGRPSRTRPRSSATAFMYIDEYERSREILDASIARAEPRARSWCCRLPSHG